MPSKEPTRTFTPDCRIHELEQIIYTLCWCLWKNPSLLKGGSHNQEPQSTCWSFPAAEFCFGIRERIWRGEGKGRGKGSKLPGRSTA